MQRLAFLFFGLVLIAGVGAGQTWSGFNSPQGYKNVRDLTINSSGSIMYAADERNLDSSHTAGATWTPTSGAISGATAVLCQYNNGNVVLASGSNFFKRSTDGGSTWTDLLTGSTNKPTAFCDFTLGAPDHMILGRKWESSTYQVLANSTNGGATWTNQLSTQTTIFDITANVNSGNPQFAVAAGSPTGTQTVKGLYHTTNYGDSWTARLTTSTYIGWTAVSLYKSALGGTDLEVAGTADGKLYHHAFNASATTQYTNFPPGGFTDTVRVIRISPANASVIFVGTDRTLYKTTDAGATWNVKATGMVDASVLSLEFNPGDGTYNTLICGTRGFIYRTTDGGSSWTVIAGGGRSALGWTSVAIRSPRILTGSRDLTMASSYDGTNWTDPPLRLGADNEDVSTHFTGIISKPGGSRNTFQAGTRDNKAVVYVSTNDGSSYCAESFGFTQASGTSGEGVVADPNIPGRIYAYGKISMGSSTFAYVYNSDSSLYGACGSFNTFSSWNPGNPVLSLVPVGDGDPAHGSLTFYGGVSGGGLWKLSNYGGNASQYTVPPTNATISAVGLNLAYTTVVYAGGTGGLWRSVNGGGSFSNVFTTPDIKRIVIDPRFTDPSYASAEIFMLGSDNNIYYSANSGTTKLNVTGNLAGYIISDVRPDPLDPYSMYAATDHGIFKAQLLTAPQNPASTVASPASCSHPCFSWSAVSGAPSYHIKIWNPYGGWGPEESDPTTTSYCMVSDLGGTGGSNLLWQVWANSNGFGPGPKAPIPAAVVLPTPPAVTLTSPSSNNQTVPNCAAVFNWSSAPAGGYHLQVSTVPSFSSPVVDQSGISAPPYTVTYLACGTKYYWHVAASNCGLDGSYSPTDSFRTGAVPAAPALSSPANGANPGCPPFTWTAPTGCATSYRLQVSTGSGFTSNLIDTPWNSTSFNPALGTLAAGTLYYWHVNATNCNGTSGWASTWSFTTGSYPGGAPSLSSPANGTTGGCRNLVFGCAGLSWTSVTGATGYRIQLDDDPNFGSPNYTFTSGTTGYMCPGNSLCVALGTYYWRVRAENCIGDGGWSTQGWSFTIDQALACQCKIAANPLPQDDVPKSFGLFQNHPNPFNPTTRFDYALAADVQVSLRIYDVLGRELRTLVDGFQEAGLHSVDFDASELPSGVYFYRLNAGKFTQMRKMILMR